LAEQPCSLGPPSKITQSAYYPGCSEISQQEIDEISTVMHSYSIGPENTRIQKTITGDDLTYTILQASVEISRKQLTDLPLLHRPVYISRGDYSSDLNYICQFLEMARLYSANLLQSKISSFHQRSFISGDLDMYKEGQRLWVKDKNPSIETNIGFVGPYRDPFGVRAEFEGIVGLVNKDETKTLANLVRHADKFVRRLPWVDNTGNGNGAFEKESFGSPDFTSLHSKCL
jgi:dipeptidyl-peptidase-3